MGVLIQHYLGVFSIFVEVMGKPDLLGLILPSSSSESSKNSFVYRSYQGTIYCSPNSAMLAPTTVTELHAIVQKAIDSGQKVKAFGSRHSISDIICTDDVPIFMGEIKHAIHNSDNTFTFGAGIQLLEALTFMESKGRTLIHVPSYGGITIGGALGTGAHGSSLLHPTSISDQVLKLTVIDGWGNFQVIDESSGDLDHFRVHLGLLGVIVNVTLESVSLFKLTIDNTLQSETILFDGTALDWAKNNDWFEMWWFPNSNEVVVSRGSHEHVRKIGVASTRMIPNTNPAVLTTTSAAFEVLQSVRGQAGLQALEKFTLLSLLIPVVGKPPLYSEDGVTSKNPATGYAWRLQSNRCDNTLTAKCAWLNKPSKTSIIPENSFMTFDLSKFSAVFTMIKDVLHQYPATFALVGIFIRFSPPSNATMATNSGRVSFTVEWATPLRTDPFTKARDGLGAYQAILQAMVKEFGGRPHWGKNGLYFTTQSVLNRAVKSTRRGKFIAAMHKYDANGVFLNKFGTRILGQSDDMDIDRKVKSCALQDYCVCSSNADCALGQICGKLIGYRVCKDVLTFPSLSLNFPTFTNLTSILEVITLNNILIPLLAL